MEEDEEEAKDWAKRIIELTIRLKNIRMFNVRIIIR